MAGTPATSLEQQTQDLIDGGNSDRKAVGGYDPNYKVMRKNYVLSKDEEAQRGIHSDPNSPIKVLGNKEVGIRYWDDGGADSPDYPAGWAPQDILKLQLQMKDAGVIPKNQKYTPGLWDSVSRGAMERVMTYANSSGRTKEEVIDNFKQAKLAEPQDNSPLTLQVKSPQDIDAVLKDSAAKVIGRSLSPSELTMLREGYQSLDRTAQERKAAADALADADPTNDDYANKILGPNPVGANGTIATTAAPAIDSYANDQLRQRFKGEADYQTGLGRMKDFYAILGEGGGSYSTADIGGK